MLCLITNRHLISSSGDFLKTIENALKGGVSYLILREKDLPFDKLCKLAKDVKQITDTHGTKLIINNNVAIAKKVDAYGVQLSIECFKNPIDFQGVIGASVHSTDEARQAIRCGSDYVLASHIFPTDCKKGIKGKGVELIREIKHFTDIPVIALGGINIENVNEVVEAGADGIAVMSGIMSANEPYRAVRNYREAIIKSDKRQ